MEETSGRLPSRGVVIFAVATLAGCCGTCINFDDQSPGTEFNVGDSISTPEIPLNVEPFERQNGSMDSSGVAKVDNRNYAGGTGNDLNTRFVNLHPQHAEPLEKIRFRFGELGGYNNIGINGSHQLVTDLVTLDNTTIAGAQIKVNATQHGNNWYGTMKIEGQITDFFIGGEELWLDDYCYTVSDCTQRTFYRDADGDGFGSPSGSVTACTAPEGYIEVNADCHDGESLIHPGAPELCDNKDNDCDGQVDEDNCP